ncbi:DUF2244 domain-containing protein [Brevirhabdus sp.]|uniref:DUF2244 domain-containing protein n=1 Tax=Brevirhabdus sp. TaxID=2004514 RepID=UPI004057E7E0
MPVKRLDRYQDKAPVDSGAFSSACPEPACPAPGAPSPSAVYCVVLWPNRSLTRRGFAGFLAATSVMIALPLFSVLGTNVLWALLPFLMLAVAGVWYAIERNYDDGRLTETLSLSRDAITLVRHNPRGKVQEWSANPYWTKLRLHEKQGPVLNYLTLEGHGRTVELGAFLSPEERSALHEELSRQLARLDYNG